MSSEDRPAPGWPGIDARWTSSAKNGIGTALSRASRVWFTLSHGILNEVYYPRVDQACTRDLGLIVTDGKSFFSEEKRHTKSEISQLAAGVPAYRLINTCLQGRYRIEKQVLTDPERDVVLQQIAFSALRGTRTDYRVYALLAPHLGNHGAGNTGWTGEYKGLPMLFAQREDNALALACSLPWRTRSAGFVGVSDGWQDLSQHRQMRWSYIRAENGNVALTAEVDLRAAKATGFLLVVGFGENAEEAGQRALASLEKGFAAIRNEYVSQWQGWHKPLLPLGSSAGRDLAAVSAAVLRGHEDKRFPGGIIASLSIPWGFSKGDDDLGGYHLVWPRDLVEAAGGLVAVGATEDALRVLEYLETTQEADGHWAQNMWLDGESYWQGVQMDETAFPILLLDLLRRAGALAGDKWLDYAEMTRRAAGYIVRNGPVTQQDRWEEDPGYSPFTLAVEISALLVAADLLEANGEPQTAAYLRETADAWNESIERWTYVTGTEIARQSGVEGYYVRIGAPEEAEAASPMLGFVPIKNRPPAEREETAGQIVSTDFLALVRFGLRSTNDPRIVNSVKVIDRMLRDEMPQGPVWHRYNGDGYGEHEDGSPFDGTGIGRAWPLLTGERAHYELAAGRKDVALRLLKSLEGSADDGGMIPEQIWDAPDIPDRELFFGKASGSARPLVWAHAEHLKLRRSLRDGQIFDLPECSARRYAQASGGRSSAYCLWRFNNKCRCMLAGRKLRIELLSPATVHWSVDGWSTVQDTATSDSSLGVFLADLTTEKLAPGATVIFTFYWTRQRRWEGKDFAIAVG